METPGPSPALFFETINAYQRTQALKAAIELDLFSHLTSGTRTAEELASACEASPKGVRVLADYLTIMGFLKKTDHRYELTPDSAVFLNKNSPAYLGGTLQFLLAPSLTDCFAKLTTAVRQGGTAISDEGTVSDDNPIWVDFARGMAPLMHLPAQLLMPLIGGDRQQPLKVLDVAAGHGMFGITVAKQYPNAQVTVLDWKNVLTVASENAAQAGVGNRHHLLPGSAFTANWGGPYDIVLLTNFYHHFDLPTCQQIAERAYSALAPGGRAITLEFIPDDNRITPPGAATFALTMLASTGHGDAYTFAEYEKIFQAAGFARNEFHALPPTMQQAIVSHRD